jgi:hypothetical protein
MIDVKKQEQRKKDIEKQLKEEDLSAEDKKKLEKQLKLVDEVLKPKYYTVVIEVTIPATVKYKVLAQTPEEALEKAKKMAPTDISKKVGLLKRISAKVMKYGTLFVELTKSL